MLIGNNYADNKIYRGIRHYDSLPYLSEDMHEFSDTLYMKTAYIMNNIIGYGILNTPDIAVSNEGIRLNEPAVVLIDGDVSLIQSDDNVPLVSKGDILAASHTSGAVCILGWYQSITANEILYNYGGVRNSKLPNDLLDNKFGVQVSTRYQFRWVPVIVNTSDIDADSIRITAWIPSGPTEDSELPFTSVTTDSYTKSGDIFIFDPTVFNMNAGYFSSDLYLVPLLKYTIDSDGNIAEATPYLPVKPKGTSGFIKSETEPVGEYIEGTTWYNPITREFKTYVVGDGFVDSAATMGFLQYQSVYSIPEDKLYFQDIDIPVNISELQESDIMQVVYEGLVLTAGEHYTVDYSNQTITLLGFTVAKGEKITFTVTKIVEANDITNITATFVSHMASTGSDTIRAHVKLSDTPNKNSGVSDGVAATPKAVYEAKLIKDEANNINYKFGVESGLLYLEEV